MTNENDAVIVSAVRTPFGWYGGSLKNIDYYDLGAIPMKEVVKRINISSDVIEGAFWG
jgi:acetyl-CoA C-acetyltransferase